MRQNRKKQTTNSETIREKHACPKPASKQFQGTGKNRFDPQTQKTTGTKNRKTAETEFEERDTRICTGLKYASTLGLHLHLESLDPATRKIFSTALNAAHYDIVHTVLELLNEKGVVFSSLDGEILQITIRFVKNPSEGP
ncbi:MAG TPA: hypothetical protein O0W87_03855 [Methanocorpusculum sp.]|nr:hypothetical protein [Methanocorpusculum sp.]